ncbi:MAG TPA: FMN-binding protein [Burkholderiaceae bacterium]
MRVQLVGGPVAMLVALAPASAFATDYLSAEQAGRLMFPQAERFEPRDIAFDTTQLQALEKDGLHPSGAHLPLMAAKRGDATLGYVVVDEVLGKFERISYAVGIDTSGALVRVEILSYRESHGGEVRLPAWRNQFVGKTHAAPLRVGEDIANISGATLSCTHITDGIRRVVALVDLARQQGGLR